MPALPPFTVFDVETTGLDPKKGHRIIEIAGVRVENGTILREAPFVSFVNPEREIPWEAKQINKISDDDVRDAPTIDVVLPQFLDFAKESLLVAHNAAFDMSFLATEKEYCWGYIDLPEALCTMRLSQGLAPHEFRHNLDVLCRKFNLAFPADRHRALDDTILAAEVFLKLLETGRITDLDKLRRHAGLRALALKK